MKRALFCAVLSLTFGVTLRAQAQICPDDKGGPVPGTVGANLLSGAIDRNAQIFGAASMAERQVLPILAANQGAILRYEMGATPGVLRTPLCSENGVEMGKVDLSGGGFGFGYRTGAFSLYAVGTGATHTMGGAWNERIGAAFMGIGLAQGSPIAFYKRRFAKDEGSLSVTFDAMVGAQVVTPHVSGSLAYAASKGLYGNLNLTPVTAFVSAVYQAAKEEVAEGVADTRNDLLDRIPYARLGFTTLDFITGAAKEAGTTSLYLRRLQYASVPRGEVSFDSAKQTLAETGLTTYHLDQYGLFERVDFSAALATEPDTFLQEASVGVRFGNPMPTDVAMAKIARGGDASGFSGVRAVVGVVRVPSVWYYGVEGGYRVRGSVEASLAASSSGRDFFSIRMGFNSPETLSLYPYANNAGDVYFGGAYSL